MIQWTDFVNNLEEL